MKRSQEEFGFLSTRIGLFDDRLARIRAQLMGDAQSVSALVCGADGTYSNETTRQLAEELTQNVDDLQKAWWLQPNEHDEPTDRALEASPAWQELRERITSYEEEVSFDLGQAPTTLMPEQRETLYALFYCLLRACTCPALACASVGMLREMLAEVGELIGGAEEEEELPGRVRCLTHERLLFDELTEERNANHPFCGLRTPFDRLDAIWHAVRGESVGRLEDPDELQRFLESDAWKREVESAQWVEEQQAEQPGLRRIAGVEPERWRGMNAEERYQAVREALDDAEEALRRLPEDQIYFLGSFEGTLYEMGGVDLAGYGPAWWEGLGHNQRVSLMRRACDWEIQYLSFADDLPDPYDEIKEIEERYHTKVLSLYEVIRAWADETGNIDELFEQYRLLRHGLFEAGLPQGAPLDASRTWGRWYAEGFSELASTALELALGERGLSHMQNDHIFHQTYAALGSLEAELELSIDLARTRRAGRAGAPWAQAGSAGGLL